MLCYVMLCYVMLCYAMPYHAMTRSTPFTGTSSQPRPPLPPRLKLKATRNAHPALLRSDPIIPPNLILIGVVGGGRWEVLC